MYFDITESNKKMLQSTFKDLTSDEKKKIVKHLIKIGFSKKTSSDVLNLFDKSLLKDSVKFASYLYDYIVKNNIIDKAYSSCKIKSRKKIPEDIDIKDEHGNSKKIIGYSKWYDSKKYEKITDWSKIKQYQKICSIYSNEPLYFMGINNRGVYIKKSLNDKDYIIKSIDFWLKIKN